MRIATLRQLEADPGVYARLEAYTTRLAAGLRDAAREAGVGTLVLIHIQPWGDAEATVAAAREEFDGEIVLGTAGMQF